MWSIDLSPLKPPKGGFEPERQRNPAVKTVVALNLDRIVRIVRNFGVRLAGLQTGLNHFNDFFE